MTDKAKRTEWMKSNWGVFAHYLPDLASAVEPVDCTVKQWNDWIDHFDVDRLARQLSDVGAGYFFITLGQNSGFFLSPNETYDSMVQRQPSRLSQRDLVTDLCEALLPKGIKILVYIPSHAPINDLKAVEQLACTPEWDASKWAGLKPGSYQIADGIDQRLSRFQQNWEAIIREWSQRWGKAVSGWWVDGCYYNDKLYEYDNAPNFASFADAMRAGNPDAVLAFNTGVKTPLISGSKYDDYIGGELSDALPVANKWHQLNEFIEGARYHAFTYMGEWWGAGQQPRLPDELAVGYTRLTTGIGGAMTWDVPLSREGEISDPFMRQLEAIGKGSGK